MLENYLLPSARQQFFFKKGVYSRIMILKILGILLNNSSTTI
jgi:hypothetical protein